MKDKEKAVLSYIAVIAIVVIMVASCVSAVEQVKSNKTTDDKFSYSVSELNENGGKIFLVDGNVVDVKASSNPYSTNEEYLYQDVVDLKIVTYTVYQGITFESGGHTYVLQNSNSYKSYCLTTSDSDGIKVTYTVEIERSKYNGSTKVVESVVTNVTSMYCIPQSSVSYILTK